MKEASKFIKGLFSKANEVFVSDITYVESAEGVHYLSLVTDAYTRQIKGYKLSNDMRAKDLMQALHMAMQHVTDRATRIHHSDRGSQYCSELYQSALRHYGISPSMTDTGDCYQNATHGMNIKAGVFNYTMSNHGLMKY